MRNLTPRPVRPFQYVALLAVSLGVLAVSDLTGQRRGPGQWRTVLVDGHEAIEGEVLVRFRTKPGGFEEARAAVDVETDESETIGRNGLRRWRSRRLGTRALIAQLRANPDVEFAEPNYVIRVGAVPSDPYFGNLWGLFNSGQPINLSPGIAGADIDAPLAWDVSTGSRDHVIGVVDTGIDYNHPDLAANIWSAPSAFTVTVGGLSITCPAGSHGFHALLNTCNPMDDHSHGTHVAGTIGAVGNNGIGITGVNWTASMMGLKFLSAGGSGTTADAIKAIDFAIQAKAYFSASAAADVRVLSNSWGGGGFSTALLTAINRADAAGMLFVAAAGNDAMNNDLLPQYPSSFAAPNVLAVASTTNRDLRSSFSNYGAVTVDLGAPGSDILSTTPNNTYAYFHGTSMATPHVSGAAQLLLSHCTLTTAELKSALMASATPIAALSGITVTGGRLNVNNAIRTCPPKGNPLPVVTALSPSTTYAGRPLTLTVDGARFASTSEVRMDGATLATTYVSSTRLTAAISATDVGSAGPRAISVFSPSPGGGTSGAVTLSVLAPPTITVNGSAGALSVETGATMSITVAGGPANVYDWVTIAPVGSSDQTYTGIWFLNGTSAPPAVGVPAASFQVKAPSTAGAYEVRFLASGRYQRLATSGVVTVQQHNPSPQLTAISPSGVAAGTSGVSIVLTGSGFSASSQALFDGAPRPTTVNSATMMTAVLSAADLVSAAAHSISAQTPAPGGGTSAARTFTVTATPPAPVLTSLSPSSVAANVAITLAVTGAGFAPNSQIVVDGVARATTYVSSTSLTTPIAGGEVSATASRSITVVTPAPGGGTSSALTLTVVGPSLTVNGSSGAVSVAPGAATLIEVANGPGHVYDWVTIVPVGSVDTAYAGIWFLSGSSTPPATGRTSAAFTIPAPATTGTYEVRFLASGKYQRLATSGVITVGGGSAPPPPPPPPSGGMLTVNGSSDALAVAAGVPLTIAITNGPGHVYDWVTIVPVGSADTAYGGIWFLSGTSTPPPSGLANATFTIPAPATAGTYEVRFLASGKYQRLATSGVITVGSGSPLPPPPPPPSGGMLTVNGSAGAISTPARAALTIAVTNGPGHVYDWITIVGVGSADTAYTGIWFLNGTSIPPASGLTNATFTIPAPATAGTYEVRFLASGKYQRLATSGVITVLP